MANNLEETCFFKTLSEIGEIRVEMCKKCNGNNIYCQANTNREDNKKREMQETNSNYQTN